MSNNKKSKKSGAALLIIAVVVIIAAAAVTVRFYGKYIYKAVVLGDEKVVMISENVYRASKDGGPGDFDIYMARHGWEKCGGRSNILRYKKNGTVNSYTGVYKTLYYEIDLLESKREPEGATGSLYDSSGNLITSE